MSKDDKTFGRMGASVGDKCGNLDERYTCPGCYHDHFKEVSECECCGSPLECYEEEVTNYYCKIRDPEDDSQ